MEKNIFIFDENKCVGCGACVVACINENGFNEFFTYRNVMNSNPEQTPGKLLYNLSIACNHCEDSPCLKNCPAKAYSKDLKTGAIIHNPNKCIGCKYCTWACPYNAPKYNPQKKIVEKCTFCNHRLSEGLIPACTNACPTGALDFSKENFTKEDSQKSTPVMVDVGASLKIKKHRRKKSPEMDLTLFEGQKQQIIKHQKTTKISAKKEIPLLIFTLLTSLLIASYPTTIKSVFPIYGNFVFLGLLGIAIFLSSLHLGRKERAYRAIFNIKNSWLSREILSLDVFLSTAIVDIFIFEINSIIFVGIGLFFLLSVDMLYSLAMWKWKIKIHSAQTLLIASSLFLLFNEFLLLFSVLTFSRLVLYILRKSLNNYKYSAFSILRILTLILSIIFAVYSKETILAVFIMIFFSDIIDRVEFYNELDVSSPKVEILK